MANYCVWIADGPVADVRANLESQAQVDDLIAVLQAVEQLFPNESGPADAGHEGRK